MVNLIFFTEYTEVIRLLHIINGRVKQNTELITALLNHQCDNIQRIEPEGEDINIPAKSYQELMELDQKLFDEKTRNFIVLLSLQRKIQLN